MNLTNERFVKSVEYDMTLTDEETKYLKEYALKLIVDDTPALTKYAINRILLDIVEGVKGKNKILQKIIKKAKKQKGV